MHDERRCHTDQRDAQSGAPSAKTWACSKARGVVFDDRTARWATPPSTINAARVCRPGSSRSFQRHLLHLSLHCLYWRRSYTHNGRNRVTYTFGSLTQKRMVTIGWKQLFSCLKSTPFSNQNAPAMLGTAIYRVPTKIFFAVAFTD